MFNLTITIAKKKRGLMNHNKISGSCDANDEKMHLTLDSKGYP
jgi:hypothetical protein